MVNHSRVNTIRGKQLSAVLGCAVTSRYLHEIGCRAHLVSTIGALKQGVESNADEKKTNVAPLFCFSRRSSGLSTLQQLSYTDLKVFRPSSELFNASSVRHEICQLNSPAMSWCWRSCTLRSLADVAAPVRLQCQPGEMYVCERSFKTKWETLLF